MAERRVQVVDHDPTWHDEFLQERDRLQNVLHGAALAIHHIGSTSVAGLPAKPVIDILVEAPDLSRIDALVPRLESDGYESKGEHGIRNRRYFSRPGGTRPKVHVHVFPLAHPAIARHLMFRDYLREHPEAADRYAQLKRRLARIHARDRDAYQEGKAAFIESIQQDAARWAGMARGDDASAGGYAPSP